LVNKEEKEKEMQGRLNVEQKWRVRNQDLRISRRTCQPVGDFGSQEAVGIRIGNQWIHACSTHLPHMCEFKMDSFMESFQCLLLSQC